jgi:hypothetical protein
MKDVIVTGKTSLSKAQNLIEFTTIGVLVLSLSLAGLFFFGDALADLFADNNANTLFTSEKRTALDP